MELAQFIKMKSYSIDLDKVKMAPEISAS